MVTASLAQGRIAERFSVGIALATAAAVLAAGATACITVLAS